MSDLKALHAFREAHNLVCSTPGESVMFRYKPAAAAGRASSVFDLPAIPPEISTRVMDLYQVGSVAPAQLTGPFRVLARMDENPAVLVSIPQRLRPVGRNDPPVQRTKSEFAERRKVSCSLDSNCSNSMDSFSKSFPYRRRIRN
jgi:hypothetical protein